MQASEGEWWGPDQPDNKFEGILYIEEGNQGKLTIRGPSSYLFDFSLRVGRLPLRTIFGNLTSQSTYPYKVTLFNPVITRGGAKYQDGDHKTDAVFLTNNIIIGAHIASDDDPIVNAVLVGITGLEEWYDITGFSANIASYFPVEKVDLLYEASHSPSYNIGSDKNTYALVLIIQDH